MCLYAIFLASWLHTEGKAFLSKFFVSDRIYLWRHIEMPTFTKMLSSKEGGDHANRLNALRKDLEDGLVRFLIYMPSVRKFFAEDLPRVVRLGDQEGWNVVPYHVNPRCGSCDWLGNRTWLSDKDKKHFDPHPDYYCAPNAEASDHLSKMPTLSKGATNVLNTDGHLKVAGLVGIKADAPVLRKHALLKQTRGHISHQAESIVRRRGRCTAHNETAYLRFRGRDGVPSPVLVDVVSAPARAPRLSIVVLVAACEPAPSAANRYTKAGFRLAGDAILFPALPDKP